MEQELRDLLSSGAETGAAKLVAGQAPKGMISKDLAGFLSKDAGISDLNQAGDIQGILTGSADNPEGQSIITKAVENGILNHGPQSVPVSDLLAMNTKGGITAASGLKGLLDNNMGLDELNTNKALSFISNNMGKLPIDVSGSTDSQSALNLMRLFRNKGFQFGEQAAKSENSYI